VHKLTQRISAWRSFKKKSLPWNDLPAEFREVKGLSDPPHAEYSYLTELEDIVASYISPEMQRTMCTLMLAEKMTVARQLTPNHRE
jgi:hypothetical protein